MTEAIKFLQALINGLVIGSTITLAAVGLTLSYGVTRFINFAYGEFLTYGAYITWAIVGLGLGLPGVLELPVAALVSVVVVGGLAIASSRLFYRPLRDRGPIPLLITSLGVAFVLRFSLNGVVGNLGKSIPVPLIPPFEVAGVFLAPVSLLMILVAAAAMAGLHLLLNYTMLGKLMRATNGNRQLVEISGVNVDEIIRKTWFISGALGGLSGILFALNFQPFTPSMGWSFLLVVFSATIVGGIGKPYGAMVGSVIIGLVMSLGTVYVDTSYTLGYAFVVLLVVLLVKPDGIAGGESV